MVVVPTLVFFVVGQGGFFAMAMMITGGLNGVYLTHNMVIVKT